MAHKFVYVTYPDMPAAEKAGTKIIQNKLAACVNIWPQMTSIYEWAGKIQREKEVVLICKTTEAGEGPLTDFIREHHSYEVPCVVVCDISGGNPDFLSWIGEQVG